MGQFGIGQPVRRTEDERFLKGAGSYTDDLALPGQLHAVVVRAPLAHAAITGIDTAAAAAAPGVRAVLTAADYQADGLGAMPCMAEIGCPVIKPTRYPLQAERVRHVGDPVAFVVADSLAAARDAAELVEVGYEPLPVVADMAAALAEDAPQLWPEAPGNVVFHFRHGDAAATAEAFARAAHVVELELVNNRVVVAPMEPRAALGQHDAETGRYTLRFTGQAIHGLRGQLAQHIFHLPPERFRLIAPDVGGGFGMKNFLYPEMILVLWAAQRLGRPVRWVAERSEGFLADAQGRDQIATAALALDEEHRFLGLRVETIANMGGYLSTHGPLIPTRPSAPVMGGCYRIGALDFQVRGVVTNTVPTDAYRGAGRPEAAYIIERLVDRAARELDLDPAELRRLNFVRPADLPYRTAAGQTLDSGDFAGTMDKALDLADRAGFAARRRQSAAAGRLRGFGMASYFEVTLGMPQEAAELRFEEDGRVTLVIGTMSNGQGLETGYAQILNEVLGLDPAALRMIQGDTDLVATGGGHGGSRSLQLGGTALFRAAEAVRERGLALAAEQLEAAAADIRFEDGVYRVVGTDRTVTLQALARERENGRSRLDARGQYEREAFTFPNGCHVVEVEIDPDTGMVTVDRYAVCDDFGRVINPLLIEGQVDGGVVQGLGQALLERTAYDPASGQLLSGSFMDYAMPRADDVPPIAFTTNPVPTQTNPLGIKGAGEAGCVGALPAIVNAILDALAPRGIEDIDMPVRPETVWRLLRDAG
jgi:carbon-monoxide dehydrogenase large subunit